MQQIIVGVNLSNQSSFLLKYALELAQYFEAQLTVAHIIYERVADLTKPRSERAKAFETYRLKQQKVLTKFIQEQRATSSAQIVVQPIVRYGGTYSELCQVAEDIQADLLIVGKLIRFGSSMSSDLSHRLLAGAPCPILVVPDKLFFRPLKNIAYLSNFQLEDCAVILKLKYWADIFDAQISNRQLCETAASRKSAEQRLDILAQVFPQDHIYFETMDAAVEKSIVQYTQQLDTDLIVLLQRKRNLWEGFFKRSLKRVIAGETKVPTLIFQQRNL
ncbi:MAG: universal stress protein [Bacteroidota bacterium]